MLFGKDILLRQRHVFEALAADSRNEDHLRNLESSSPLTWTLSGDLVIDTSGLAKGLAIDTGWVLGTDYSKYCSLLSSSTSVDALSERLHGLAPDYHFAVERSSNRTPYIPSIVLRGESAYVPLVELGETMGTLDILDSIAPDEIARFYTHLSEYPMLGLAHQVGARILKDLRAKTKRFVECPRGLHLFRARAFREGREMPFGAHEMIGPTVETSKQGRFNVAGQSARYTADTKEGAITESRNDGPCTVQVDELELLNPMEFLDLTGRQSPLIKHCSFSTVGTSPHLGAAYLVPNFVSQCCRHHRIQGIRYGSTKNPGSVCYVFLDRAESWFRHIGTQRESVL
jgi:hypothetical protein